jgi:cytoskeletal protein CcmA (bactofilin family)
MFSKQDKDKSSAPAAITSAPSGKTAPSLLSADITIQGAVTANGEVQIDGSIDGDVTCGKLIVGERANINGAIKAASVLVRGKVVGRIEAQQVELMRSARVQGDIWHETVAIEAGAYLDGMCKRLDQKDDAAAHTDIAPIDSAKKNKSTMASAIKAEVPAEPTMESTEDNDAEQGAESTPPFNPRRATRTTTFGSADKQASGND